jgi:PKHD-type hydroxylase
VFTLLPKLLDSQTICLAMQALARLPAEQWEDGGKTAGPQAVKVKDNLQLPREHPANRELVEKILQALDGSALFFSVALPARIVPPRVNCYRVLNASYGVHVDNSIRVRPDGLKVRTDLACTVFLNDPSEYDGGELVVHEHDAVHSFKQAAGDAVLYRSDCLHQVTPVTRGARYACFFWIQSMVRSHDQRKTLFDLDTNLMALRDQCGELPELVALTAVYHQLLRSWAEV